MIQVAIIEDNITYRKSLETYIGKTDDLEIVYAASDCRALGRTVAIIKPDVLIMDIEMRGLTGIQGIREVKENSPRTSVCMLTFFDDDQNILASIKAGALGYLLKKDQPADILEAIRKIHRGEAVLNGKVARKILEFHCKKPERKQSRDEFELTSREKEILELIVKGKAYKQIAAACFISIDTVSTHVRKIFSKLNVHSRSELSAKFR